MDCCHSVGSNRSQEVQGISKTLFLLLHFGGTCFFIFGHPFEVEVQLKIKTRVSGDKLVVHFYAFYLLFLHCIALHFPMHWSK